MKLSLNEKHCHPEPAERGEGPRKQRAALFVRRRRQPPVRPLAALGRTI
jgi:hypothetical protein